MVPFGNALEIHSSWVEGHARGRGLTFPCKESSDEASDRGLKKETGDGFTAFPTTGVAAIFFPRPNR